jgi:hypothetical protein
MGGHFTEGDSSMMGITWYEWIGWTVEALLIALAIVFIGSTISEGEIRPILVSTIGFGILIIAWTWIMLKFGK